MDNMRECIALKEYLEKEADYILCKESGTMTRWFLQKKTGEKVGIDLFDRIECIYTEKSFDLQNNYKGTIFSSVIEIAPDYIRLKLNDGFAYCISEGTKIFGISKPIIVPEPETFKESLKRTKNSIKLTVKSLFSKIF